MVFTYTFPPLKKHYSFENRYSVPSMGILFCIIIFMWAGVGAPGSTHDSCFWRNCTIYAQIEDGILLPNKKRNLSPNGEIPFLTVGDSAFPCRRWLLKPYVEGTRVPQQRYFNKRPCSAKVVSEHAYIRDVERPRENFVQKFSWHAFFCTMYAFLELIPVYQDGALKEVNLVRGNCVQSANCRAVRTIIMITGCGMLGLPEMLLIQANECIIIYL